MITNIEELEKEETKRLLNEFKMPQNWLGTKFIITAIPYAIDKICSGEKLIINEVYKYVAKKHKTTSSKVECAIRYFHENTNIASKFNIPKVTNQRLILLITNKVIEKLNL